MPASKPNLSAPVAPIPYPPEELFRPGMPRVYRGRELDELAFPLGGIGTGSIALGGWGQLRDFEIFNSPNKGMLLNSTFFTLHMQPQTGAPVTRVLQGPVGSLGMANIQAGQNNNGMGGGGHGVTRKDGAGLPHFRNCQFVGQFPFANVELSDAKAPLTARLEAFNPFIPLNPDDSGLPVAMFNIHLTNPTDQPVQAVLYANLENKVGFPDVGLTETTYFEAPGVRGLQMTSRKHKADSPRHGSFALCTPHTELQVQTHWFRGGWFDPLTRFWDQVSAGQLEETREPAILEGEKIDDRNTDIGSIGLKATVPPGQTVVLPVWLIWHTPLIDWKAGGEGKAGLIRNYYATKHADALAVAKYLGTEAQRLEAETRTFTDALFSSTLPAAALDGVSSQISILKTTTCLRLEDGTFYGWEGCHNTAGCCEGTCTHVWNYAQALPFLFPSLERTIRDSDYKINLHDDGAMTFRMPLPLGVIPNPKFHPAADGQMGGILKVYREWQISGDDAWLKKIWPATQRSLEYAWKFWDADKDGVMEGIQHNTYDIEFYGPNSMMGGFYLGALRAGEEIARHLGDTAKADEYRKVFESGRKKMDQELFNGEFYIQDVRPDAVGSHDKNISMGGQSADPKNKKMPKYQYGTGCLADQLIGQWFARIVGLGDLFDPAHVRKTVESIFKYNWRGDLSDHANPQRIYALGDEAGLLLCSWPRGGRPALPFPYSDEVWPGLEHELASLLIYEGLVAEGLAVEKGVRDRHTGTQRNPWNEYECGHHYSRSMAAYSVLLALSGFQYSAPAQRIGFAPKVYTDNFAAFFSVAAGWGMLRQQLGPGLQRATVELTRGALTLREIDVGFAVTDPTVTCAGKSVKATAAALGTTPGAGTRITLAHAVTLKAGQALTVDGWPTA